MICLDIYDEENQIYTPYNFLYFSGFECRYNELTELYEVNGLINGAITIASFEDEELAVAVTRSLFTLKSMAEVNPRPEARFINVDMIVDELENEKEEDENDVEQCKDYKMLYAVIYMIIVFVFGIIVGVLI